MTSPTADFNTPRQIPADIRCAADYARLAENWLAAPLLAHIKGGSGHDLTASANLAAFANLAIVPRVLRSVSEGHTRCTIAGITRPHPIVLAPVGWQGTIHPAAEIASAQAAAATQTCFIASTMSSATLEDIAEAAGPDRWFQLYFQPDRSATLDLVQRAEAAGFTAIVVTVDAVIQVPSLRAVTAGYQAQTNAANLRGYPPRPPVNLTAGQSAILNGYMRDAPTFADIEWLIGETRLPVWVKGVLHADDARELASLGITGLIISNHGGRALDGAPSSLSRLAPVRAALPDNMPVLFDGGIRSGSDVFKAIACGADAVLAGRLQAYALAAAGALGVAHMIKLLREELEICMAQAGCGSLADIRQAEIVRTEIVRTDWQEVTAS